MKQLRHVENLTLNRADRDLIKIVKEQKNLKVLLM